jgi:two-component system invasion response regulator UvrY
MDPIRVVVVDDHDLVRQGIVGLLQGQEDIEVIGEANSGRDGIELVSEMGPDVVLMDIAMPGINGLDAARELSGRYPDVGIVMLTSHDREEYVFEALRAGASGYVLKGADVQELLAAVRAARRGETYLQAGASLGTVHER